LAPGLATTRLCLTLRADPCSRPTCCTSFEPLSTGEAREANSRTGALHQAPKSTSFGHVVRARLASRSRRQLVGGRRMGPRSSRCCRQSNSLAELRCIAATELYEMGRSMCCQLRDS
jgi:hypothetical protein